MVVIHRNNRGKKWLCKVVDDESVPKRFGWRNNNRATTRMRWSTLGLLIFLHMWIKVHSAAVTAAEPDDDQQQQTFSMNLMMSHNNDSSTDCLDDDENCLRCGPLGCIKCPVFIEMDSRRCVEECSRGYTSHWSTMPDYMGRVCRPTSMAANTFFLTMVCVSFVAVLGCLLVLTVIFCLRKRRRRKTIRDKLIDDNVTRTEFLRQLGELRPSAEYFLGMLNDTRRQIRKLHVNGDTMGAQAYRPIVRDLAKILLLVNKPVELLTAPPSDWLRLYMWSQRILDRYKPQMSPLIDFLQSSPVLTSDPRLASCQHHTFKSNTTNSTTTTDSPVMEPRHSYGCLISLQDFDMRSSVTLPRTDQLTTSSSGGGFKMLGSGSSSKRHSVSDVNNSALWLEDEFFNLGLRPQDEITTEL